MQRRVRINWPTTLFLIITPIVGVFGTIWWASSGRFHWATIALFFATWAATAMGITGGYHRLFSHKTYNGSGPVRAMFIFAGGAAWEGSVLEWCRDHRLHHKYVDTDRDPYNIREGFWWAHIMWLVWNPRKPVLDTDVTDLWQDPLIRFQHRYYMWTAIATSFVLPLALATLWGDPWGGLLVAGSLRIVLNHHATFFINSLCHIAGDQPYSDSHSARDNWVAALLTYGEGYHNYHHEFPSDYRNGIRAWQYDPTKWLIWTLSRLGGATGLRRIPPEKVLAKKVHMQDKRLTERLAKSPNPLTELAERTRKQAQEQVDGAVARLADLRRQYQELAQSEAVPAALQEVQHRLKAAESELIRTVDSWQRMARGLAKTATA